MKIKLTPQQQTDLAALAEQKIAADADAKKFAELADQKRATLNASDAAQIDRRIKDAMVDADAGVDGAAGKLAELKAERESLADLPVLINGLEEKKAAAQGLAGQLRHKQLQIINAVLAAEADKLGAEYLAAAQVVADKFRTLNALSAIAARQGYGFAADQIHQKFSIPMFSLPSHAGQQTPPGGADWTAATDIRTDSANMRSIDIGTIESHLKEAGLPV